MEMGVGSPSSPAVLLLPRCTSASASASASVATLEIQTTLLIGVPHTPVRAAAAYLHGGRTKNGGIQLSRPRAGPAGPRALGPSAGTIVCLSARAIICVALCRAIRSTRLAASPQRRPPEFFSFISELIGAPFPSFPSSRIRRGRGVHCRSVLQAPPPAPFAFVALPSSLNGEARQNNETKC